MPCNSLYSPKHRRSHLLPRRCIGFCQYSMTYGAWVFKLTQTTKLLLLMTWWDIGFSTLVDLKKYSCWGDIFRNHTPSLMLISHQTRRGGVPPEAMLPWRIGKFSFDPMICMKPARRTETINRIHLFRSEKKTVWLPSMYYIPSTNDGRWWVKLSSPDLPAKFLQIIPARGLTTQFFQHWLRLNSERKEGWERWYP